MQESRMVNNRIDEECQPLVQSQDRYPAYDAPTNKDVATEDGGNHIIALSNPPVWFVYIVAGCAGINSCNVGFDIGVNSPAGILVQEDMSLSDLQLEMFMGSINLFALVGALMTSQIIHWWGMRASFAISSALFVLGSMITALSMTYTTIMIGRVLVGLGVGIGFATSPNYLSEISPKEHRGYFTSWTEIGCNVGILFGFSTSLCIHANYFGFVSGWRLMFAIGCILPLVLICLALFVMVESPRWLVRRGRYQDGLDVLTRLYPGGYDVSSVLKDIQNDIELEKAMQQMHDWNFVVHPSPAVRRMLSIGLGIAICHEICGIDAIQYYLVFILQASGITNQLEQAKFLIALAFLKLACLFVSSSLVDNLGRRPLMLFSAMGMALALLLIAAQFLVGHDARMEDVANDCKFQDRASIKFLVTGLSLYLAFFSLGMGPLGWVIPPEIFSTSIRAKAVSLTTFGNRLTATVMTSTMLSISNAIGWAGYFSLLTAINITILGLAYAFLPETKGRSLEEMTEYFLYHRPR